MRLDISSRTPFHAARRALCSPSARPPPTRSAANEAIKTLVTVLPPDQLHNVQPPPPLPPLPPILPPPPPPPPRLSSLHCSTLSHHTLSWVASVLNIMGDSDVKLFCLLPGWRLEQCFSVKISRESDIDDLKPLISTRYGDELGGVSKLGLVLYCVSIANGDELARLQPATFTQNYYWHAISRYPRGERLHISHQWYDPPHG